MASKKFSVGDKVSIRNYKDHFFVVRYNENGNKIKVSNGQFEIWEYEDFVKLVETYNFIKKIVISIINFFKSRKLK